MSEDLILLNRTQCPICHSDMELTGLMDEATWDSMTVQQRVNLFKMAGLEGKYGGKSYEGLDKLTNDELVAICDYKCNHCGTDWPVRDLLVATQTDGQLEIYRREHKNEESY